MPRFDCSESIVEQFYRQQGGPVAVLMLPLVQEAL